MSSLRLRSVTIKFPIFAKTHIMLGSFAGDIIGSTYEFNNTNDYNFEPFPPGSDFTDDTVITIAVADAILSQKPYGESIRDYSVKWPGRGYGLMFKKWYTMNDPKPYNSFGNGSAMRVGPVGWAFKTIEETLDEARKSAECTHNHPEGIKGAQSVAGAIFLARSGHSKTEIRQFVETKFKYNLSRTLAQIKPYYYFNETCQETVPEAITCFLESENFEDAIRKAIWLGGDSDTLACITGSIAEAFYDRLPANWETRIRAYLPEEFIEITGRFRKKFMS